MDRGKTFGEVTCFFFGYTNTYFDKVVGVWRIFVYTFDKYVSLNGQSDM